MREPRAELRLDRVPERRVSNLPQLMTLGEVAKHLAVSERTVKRLIARGFPCVRVGRSLRFEPQAVARWLSARREGA
jgi:excisionase family DNA binding protein